jgi:DNA helicase-2/ATP-dependent DNA helicase PcrA
VTYALEVAIESLKCNERQWEAFNTVGHCVVIAPPGSGKTHLISTRLVSDLAYEVPRPHGAACITLTNPAAAELRSRIDRLQSEKRATLFVGTVHSFALSQIIRPFAHLTPYGHLAQRRIATREDVRDSYAEAISAYYQSHENTYFVRSTIEFYRKRMVPPQQWANVDLMLAVADYQRELLREAGLVEFDEIIEGAVLLVRDDPAIRTALCSRFPRIFVDEYQDLAPGLDLLVRSLCLEESSSSELFAVGDPDQAIFGWTGSRADLLFQLAQSEGVSPVLLTRNYRCGNEIIRAANLLRPGAPDLSEGQAGGSIAARQVNGLIPGQAHAAADEVNRLIQGGVRWHDIAILGPTNADCEEISEVFHARSIPHFVRSEEYRLTPATMLLESLACWVAFGRESSGYRLGSLLRQYRLLIGGISSFPQEVSLVDILLNASPEERASNFAVDVLETGLADEVAKAASDDSVEVASMLESMSRGSLNGSTVADLGCRARKQDRVEIATMTSSKGLEFDAVLIVGADQERIPHYRSIADPEKVAEERRKFYVSVTRARDVVRIFYSGYAITKYGRRVNPGPSIFLKEMQLV